ncbi:unnamed protein product [Ixodes persulcatus]
MNSLYHLRVCGVKQSLQPSCSDVLSAIGYCPVGEMDKLKPLPDRAREYPPGTIVSAICEWIVVLTILAFSMSFAAEFRKFKLCLRLEYRDVDGDAEPLPVKPDVSPEKPEARD